MTSAATSPARPARSRLNPTVLVVLAIAALAWAGVLAYARDMGNG